MVGSLGWQELLVVLLILALLFGAQRVGELGGAFGKRIREFRKEASADTRGTDEREGTPGAKPDESSPKLPTDRDV